MSVDVLTFQKATAIATATNSMPLGCAEGIAWPTMTVTVCATQTKDAPISAPPITTQQLLWTMGHANGALRIWMGMVSFNSMIFWASWRCTTPSANESDNLMNCDPLD